MVCGIWSNLSLISHLSLVFIKYYITFQVLNPLDAICNVQRKNAICINQLKFGKKTDADVLKERPDVKIFLPFKFHIYDVNELFNPGRYQRYMGNECPSFLLCYIFIWIPEKLHASNKL